MEEYETTRLAKLGTKRQQLERAQKELRPDLAEEIRKADAAKVPQVEIVRLTGYTREQVRRICLPPKQRAEEDRVRRQRRKGARER